MKAFKIKIVISLFLLFYLLSGSVLTSNAYAGFRFVAWGDTKSGTSTLSSLSNQVKAMSPVLTIYAGDAISSGTVLTGFVSAINGGSNNGILDKSFLVRGNHDSSATTTWQQTFEFSQTAQRIGATNYSALNTDLTYSFDYQNAHYVGIDNLGSATGISSAQITWLDQDLTRAAQRGLKHAFLFWHGPLYTVDSHMASVNTALATVINRHPIISATFHGHEHVETHTTLNQSRIPQLTTLTFEQFVSGTAGAGAYSCSAGRSDFCGTFQGFVVIDVLSDTQFKTGIYKQGTTTPQWERTFTKGQPVTTSVTITPTGATRTPTPGSRPGDCEGGDGDVDILDFQKLQGTYNKTPGQTGYVAACNFATADPIIDLLDFQILANNFGR